MSIERYFPGSRSRKWLRAGPLADDLEPFADLLAALGYPRQSIVGKLRLIRNLSHWMEQEGIGLEALDEQQAKRFLSSRPPVSKLQGEAATLRLLLGHLRDGSRIPLPPAEPDSNDPIERIVGQYARSLSWRTAKGCLRRCGRRPRGRGTRSASTGPRHAAPRRRRTALAGPFRSGAPEGAWAPRIRTRPPDRGARF